MERGAVDFLMEVHFFQGWCNLGSGWCANIQCTLVGGEHNLGGGNILAHMGDAKEKPFCEKGGRG